MVNAYAQAVTKSIDQIDEVATTPYEKNYSKERKQKLINLLISKEPSNVEVLKFHQSLCPGCVDEEKFNKMKIDCVTYVKNNKVWMLKECEEHGVWKEVYWADWDMYKKAERFQDPGIKILNPHIDKSKFQINCPNDCGLCVEHESHTGLGNIVITNRCDLTCWYCLPGEEELMIKQDNAVKLVKIESLENMIKNEMESVKIGNIEGVFGKLEGVEALTFNSGIASWTKIKKLFKRPYKEKILEIKTKTGRSVKVTPEHMIALQNGKDIIKKPAVELKIGDKLLASVALPASQEIEIDLLEAFVDIPETEKQKMYVHNIREAIAASSGGLFYSWRSRDTMPLSEFYKLSNTDYDVRFGRDASNERIPRKLKINKDMAKIIGYFISDGHYTYKDLRITCKDKIHVVEIIECIKRLGLKYSILNLEKHGKASQIVIGSRNMRLVFKHALGIPEKASQKRIPKLFFGLSEELKAALLSGLFNGDGFVTRAKRHASIGIATVSKGLARDITYLLSSFGIFCRKYVVKKEKMKGANYDLQKLYIAGKDMETLSSILELKNSHKAKLLGLSPRKEAKIERTGDFFIDEVKEITSIKSNGLYVYDIEVENSEHVFLAGDGILVSNCFFYAKEGEPIYDPTLDQIKFMLKRMRNEKPVGANSVQFTGGEPTLREDLPEIVAVAKEIGYDHVQLNTNGVNLSKDPELAKKLRASGVSNLYMSFDGLSPATNPKNYWEAPGALENCHKAGIGVVLVPTVIGGINDHELGDIIRFGFDNIHVVRAVNFQPVSLVGRMPDRLRKRQRITIPGSIRRIEEQTDGQIGKEHWFPVPCAKQITDFIEALKEEPKYRLSIHFACGMATYAFKDGDRMKALPEFFDIEGFFEYLGELTRELNETKRFKSLRKAWVLMKLMRNVGKYVDNEKKPKSLNFTKMLTGAVGGSNYHGLADFHMNSLFIGMMHFQDPYNWDIDRIHKCDIHYATPDGRVLPFCTFNVIPELYRDKIQRKFSIPAAEFEKKTGKKLNVDKYHRKFTQEEMNKIKAMYDKHRKWLTKPQIESDWGAEDIEVNTPASSSESTEPLVQIGGAGKTGIAHMPVKKHTTTHPASAGGCCGGSEKSSIEKLREKEIEEDSDSGCCGGSSSGGSKGGCGC